MAKLRIAVLQHSRGTPPGSVLEWVMSRGHHLTVYRLYSGDSLPALADFDWLISLGGPMNCDDDAQFPFLTVEKCLLKDALKTNKRVLGLCLGGQLMARALGAEVRVHSHWEAGWHSIQIDDPILGQRDLTVFQWHHDTFDVPTSARRIATNSITANQGFRLSPRAMAVQFHPEATREWVMEQAVESPYPVGPFVQSPEDVERGLSHLPEMTQWFFQILNQMEGEL